MYNSDYIHKRDITTILSQLQDDIELTEKEITDNLTEKQSKKIETKINRLISDADRDLRLKTQAIVRNKLAQSRVLPIRSLSSAISNTNFSSSSTSADSNSQISSSSMSTNVNTHKNRGKTSFPQLSQNNSAFTFESDETESKASNQTMTTTNTTTNITATKKSAMRPRAQTPSLSHHKPIVVPLVPNSANGFSSSLTNSASNNLNSIRFASTPNPRSTLSITPIIPSPQARASTTKTATRRRRLPSGARKDLPLYNRHDPLMPPPPIPSDAIDTYGLDQLLESRLLPASAVPVALDGLLQTFKIDSEPPIFASPNPAYRLDRQSDSNRQRKSQVKIISPEMKKKNGNTNANDDAEEEELKGKWVFTLYNGVPDNTAADFAAYKREYSNHWEVVQIILELLRLICKEYGLTKQRIIGSTVYELTQLDPDAVSHEKLMRCFVDHKVRRSKRQTKIGFGFIGPDAEDKAATVIQSIWRGFISRRLVRTIRRNQAARRIIARFYRSNLSIRRFRENFRADFKRKLMNFEGNQASPTTYRPDDMPFTVLHLMEGHCGSQIARIGMLSNPNCSQIIIFTRKNLPVSHIELIRSMIEDQNRVQFVVAQQKLPQTLPIEDVLACDIRSLARIRKIAERQSIFIQPASVRDAVIEISFKLSALAIMPSTTRMMMFHTHEAVRRLLVSAKVQLFESSDEVFDKTSLCKALTALSIAHLSIQQWRIRVTTGIIGWVNTNDFVLLEKLKANSDVLTEKDLEDPHFRDLLEQSLSTDLNVIIETTGTTPKIDFLREVWMNGASIEAGPRQVKCSANTAFFLPPIGSPVIVGTWETLYLSLYEPFAAIYPAFSVDRKKLKKSSLKIAAKCSEKRILGHSVINYWYSTRTLMNSLNEEKTKMVLTADDVKFAQYENVMPIFLIEQIIGRKFDEESMSFGPSTYIYIQERLVLPHNIELNDLIDRLKYNTIPTETKVKFFQDFKDQNVYTFFAVEENPSLLIILVFRVLTVLAESIFNTEIKPDDPLLGYIHSIEYLKNQVDEGELGSTAITNKVRVRDWMRASQKRFYLFQNSKEKDKNEELQTIHSAKESSSDIQSAKERADLDNQNSAKSPNKIADEPSPMRL